jgi:hypothetical protein
MVQDTHSTNKALPTPLATKRFYSLHPISDALLAFFAFRHPKPDMTRFAVWVTLVNRKSDIIVFEHAIASKTTVP